MMKRVPLGQIVGTDLFGNVVIVWVERDDEGTVLSRLSEGMRLTYVVKNPTDIEAEAAHVFEIMDVKFFRVH